MTAFWLVPDLGTEQVSQSGPPPSSPPRSSSRSVCASFGPRSSSRAGSPRPSRSHSRSRPSSRPDRGRREPELVAALPPASGAHAGALDPAAIGALGEQFTVRAARDTRYHRHDRRGRLGLALPPLRQLVPERNVARRPVPDTVPLHRLPRSRNRTPSLRAQRALHRSRRGLGAEARLARLPKLRLQVAELDPEVVDRGLQVVRAPAQSTPRPSTPTTAGAG